VSKVKIYIVPTFVVSISAMISTIFILATVLVGSGGGFMIYLALIFCTCFFITKLRPITWWFAAPFFAIPPLVILISEADNQNFNHAVFNGPLLIALSMGLFAGYLGSKNRVLSDDNT
jgi:hypothetical protein